MGFDMSTVLAVALGMALIAVALYAWLLLRVGAGPSHEQVPGAVYRVGACWVYRLPASSGRARHTVVAVHGFLQSPAYFMGLYRDCPDTEVILVGSGDYHQALGAEQQGDSSWAQPPAAPLGTIAYDAEVLRQALANLASGDTVWLHGHSRGGAVVVDAVRKDPALFDHKRLILEAPVLPQGRLFRPLPRGAVLLLPCLLPAWRRHPINERMRLVLGRLRDEHKHRLMAAMPHNPRRAITVMRNLRDIEAWMRRYGTDLLAGLPDAVVLVTPQDRILDAESMQRSAEDGGDHVRIQSVRGVSHFISIDRPSAVTALYEA